jgi:polar amino acid transport system substrate-binding protein
VRLAHQFAIENENVRGDMVEVTEFPYLVERYDVQGVPRTVINESSAIEGALPETMFVEQVLPKANLVLADNYDQAVAMLRDDKAIAMVADYPICFLTVYRYPDGGMATLSKPISYEPIGVALPASDPLLVNWVQNVFNFLEKTGELDALTQRWFRDTSWISQLP